MFKIDIKHLNNLLKEIDVFVIVLGVDSNKFLNKRIWCNYEKDN